MTAAFSSNQNEIRQGGIKGVMCVVYDDLSPNNRKYLCVLPTALLLTVEKTEDLGSIQDRLIDRVTDNHLERGHIHHLVDLIVSSKQRAPGKNNQGTVGTGHSLDL